MVYAPTTPPGRAKVVPCKHEIASLKDMVAEAAALWAAEQREERKPLPGSFIRHSGDASVCCQTPIAIYSAIYSKHGPSALPARAPAATVRRTTIPRNIR
jgi:hypothetical protein